MIKEYYLKGKYLFYLMFSKQQQKLQMACAE